MIPSKVVTIAKVVTAATVIAAGHEILIRPTRAYVADTGCGSDLINSSTMTKAMVKMQKDAENPPISTQPMVLLKSTK